LRLSFSDRISRAVLIDAKDKNSKFARSIVPLDIMEAIGIKKSTEGKINTIEDIVFLFVEREAYKFQKINEGVVKIDTDLKAGLINGTDENVKKFWENIKELILEKLT